MNSPIHDNKPNINTGGAPELLRLLLITSTAKEHLKCLHLSQVEIKTLKQDRYI